MKILPRWLVHTPERVDGRILHFFASRAKQRAFAREHNGWCYDVRRSKH